MKIIRNGEKLLPPRIFLYGGAGQGKSTFGAQSMKPIFIPTEDGLNQIVCDSFPVAESYNEVISNLVALEKEEHEYRTVVIDTVDWLEKIIWKDVCNTYSVKDIASVPGGWGKGYQDALGMFDKVRLHLDELNRKKGMAVILVSHCQTKDLKDPEVGDITQYFPKINAKAKDLLCEWCDIVGFVTRRYGSAKGEVAGNELVIKTRSTECYYAKSRYNIPDTIPLNCQALYQLIRDGHEQKLNAAKAA